MASVASAVLLGFSAGVSPGPLLMLLVAETLRHGLGAGLRVSLAPLLSDLPIVALSFFLLARLADLSGAMALITLAGAALLLWLGYGGLRFTGAGAVAEPRPPRSLRKAVLTNFLNPNPYLFWLLVGGPLVLAAWRRDAAEAVAFVVLFYLLLVGCKLVIALLVHRSRDLLRGRTYLWVVRGAGLALMLYGLAFANRGLHALGLIGGG